MAISKTIFIGVPGITIATPVKKVAKPYALLSPFASYLLGTSLSDDPVADLSGNGRNLTKSLAPTRETFGDLLGRDLGFWVCPFSMTDLVAVNGSCTMAAIVKLATGDNFHMMGAWNNNVGQIGIAGTAGGTYAQTISGASNTLDAQATLGIVNERNTWALVMGTFTQTLHEIYTRTKLDSAARYASAVRTASSLAKPGSVRVGGNSGFTGGSFSSNSRVHWAGFYPGVLSAANFDAIYDSFKQFNLAWGNSDVTL